MAVSGYGVDAEDPARLTYHVDELLEDVRHRGIPHRNAEYQPLGRVEAVECPARRRPSVALGAVRSSAGEHRHLCPRPQREVGQRPIPEVPMLDLRIRMGLLVHIGEQACDAQRLRRLAAWRGRDVQQLRHCMIPLRSYPDLSPARSSMRTPVRMSQCWLHYSPAMSDMT